MTAATVTNARNRDSIERINRLHTLTIQLAGLTTLMRVNDVFKQCSDETLSAVLWLADDLTCEIRALSFRVSEMNEAES